MQEAGAITQKRARKMSSMGAAGCARRDARDESSAMAALFIVADDETLLIRVARCQEDCFDLPLSAREEGERP